MFKYTWPEDAVLFIKRERAWAPAARPLSWASLPPLPPLPVLPDSPLSPSHAPCPSPLHQQHALSAGRSGSEAENKLGYAGVKPRTLALLLRTLSHWTAQPQSAAHMESLSEICIINLFAEGHLEHVGGRQENAAGLNCDLCQALQQLSR